MAGNESGRPRWARFVLSSQSKLLIMLLDSRDKKEVAGAPAFVEGNVVDSADTSVDLGARRPHPE